MKTMFVVGTLISVVGAVAYPGDAVNIIAFPLALWLAVWLLKRWALWRIGRIHTAARREFARARQRREWDEGD